MSDVNDPIVIVGLSRTAMGGLQGMFASQSAPELGACAIKGALADAGLPPESIDEVYMGCVLPAGMGQAPARQAALGAGLPKSVVCTTVNKVCGSGMKCVADARNAILAGEADIVIAGGMESMSNAPHLLSKARAGYRLGHGQLLDHMFLDGLEDAYKKELMGVYAENTAEKYQFTREEQDAFALESLRRAVDAIETGKFKREITEYVFKTKKGESVLDVDEQPGNARPEKIPQLRPAFRQNGTVTAANSSSISDGAAALVITKQSVAREKGLKPLAEIKGTYQFAHEPEWFTTAPCSAMAGLLNKVGWSVDKVDLFEINEAFAVVAMAAMKSLSISHDKVNVHGGACALGHPLGASGARVIVTLLAALETYNKTTGLASLCIGGGEGIAIAIERLSR